MQSILQTERLILRDWQESDREPFFAITSDPRVMKFFPSTLTREESDLLIDRCRAHYAENGFTFYAVELRATGELIGFEGLARTPYQTPFTPCVEIGWRLGFRYWNRGFATEAARACLDFAFGRLDLDEIVAFTSRGNLRSRRVMEKLGMTRDPAEDYDHPLLPVEHPLRPHVLYRIKRAKPAAMMSRI